MTLLKAARKYLAPQPIELACSDIYAGTRRVRKSSILHNVDRGGSIKAMSDTHPDRS